MTSGSSSSGSFKTWILGILGAVITAVLIFAIEQKLTVKEPPPNIVSLNGQVFDSAAKRLLENVEVRVHVATFSDEQKTDSLGRYAFSLGGFDSRLSGSIHLEAPGYKPLDRNLSLKEMSELQDLYLEAVAPAPPTGLGATVVGGAVTSHAATTVYRARLDPRKISALAPH